MILIEIRDHQPLAVGTSPVMADEFEELRYCGDYRKNLQSKEKQNECSDDYSWIR